MADERPVGRHTVVLACFAAWIFGIGTGALLVFGYARPAPDPEAEADRRYAAIAIRPRPTMPPPTAPTPRPSEWAMPMNYGFGQAGACPQTVIEEMRVKEGPDIRTVVFTVKVTNDTPDRTCSLQRADMALRDGDGNSYHYEGEDVVVASYGVKRARLTFAVPNRLELVQLVVPDGRGGFHANDYELVQRERRY